MQAIWNLPENTSVGQLQSAAHMATKNLLGHLLTTLGNQLHRQGMYSDAQRVLNEALELAKKTAKRYYRHESKSRSWQHRIRYGDIHQAMDYYRNAIALASKLNDESIKARGLLNMGMANWQFDNNDLAISMLKESATLLEKQNDKQNLGMVYNNLGLIYFNDKHQYDSASFYFESSLRVRELLASPVPIANVLVNQANLYSATNRFDDAMQLFERSLQIFSSAGILSQVVRVNYHLGEAFQRMGKTKESIAYFEKTMALSQQAHLQTYESLARQKLLDLYASTGKWESFLTHFDQFKAEHTKLLEDYNTVSIRENRLQDTLQMAIASNELLNAQNKVLSRRVKLLESILVSLATVSAAVVLIFIARRAIFSYIQPK